MRPAQPGTATMVVALLGVALALTGCSSGHGEVPVPPAAASPTGAASGPIAAASIAAATPAADQGALTPATQSLGQGLLRGQVIVIDPGHNGGNARAASRVARLVDIGNGTKACDTTGTQTGAGYPESAFTWDVATRLAVLLRRAGATVLLTRSANTGVGPCITERAAIANRAHADVAISVHADGATPAGYGFHVIEPVSIGRNAAIVAPSARLALAIRTAFAAGTGEPYSTYTGGGRALSARSDLGGLNLSAVPKVFIECANMRNPADARRVTSPAWRQRAAAALAAGLTAYLRAG